MKKMKIYKEIKTCGDLNCNCYTYFYDSPDSFDMDVTYYCDHLELRNAPKEIRRLGSEPNFCEECPVLLKMFEKKIDNNEFSILID